MNTTKVIIGVVVGGIFTATSLAISFYLFQKNTSGSSPLGLESNFAFLGIVFGVIYGSVIGIISGAVITGLQLNLSKAILFGLLLNLILGIGLSFMLWGANWNEIVVYNFLVPMLVGVINAVIVSLISSNKLLA